MVAEEDSRAIMEREAAEMMARDFSPYTQRLSSVCSGSTKLGINSNIYSLYQNKAVGARPGVETGSSYMAMSSVSSVPGKPQSPGPGPGPGPAVETAYSELGQYTACMQERVSSSCREQDTMEPDSSTDSQEQADTNGLVNPDKDVDGQDEEEEEEEEVVENSESNNDRMQILLKEHARMFNVKPEPESLNTAHTTRKSKAYKTPQEELAELMKLTNEKLFKNTNRSLPLSVEIDEQDSSCDSVSPPRNPYMVTNSLSPRKRGRKPKHYSEILYELGQRGISITKTSKPSPVPSSQSTEMVVSENGSVSHKASGQQLKCPHCNKILTTSVGLMYHIRLHTGEKPYSCDICGKSFATSSHYHYHIRSHSGEKPYRCDFCGKMYTASGSLRLHLKSHLSRLAANAFNTINLPGFPMGQNGSMGLPGMSQDPLQIGSNDLKFGIKQEVFDNNDTSESPNNNQTGESSTKTRENSNNIGLNNKEAEDE